MASKGKAKNSNSSNKKVAPSILSADFSKLGEEIQAVEKAGADWIHIDVMDGHFVPNLTIGPVVINGIRKKTKLPFDVHLMIENPDFWIEDFAKAGADIITIHQEACSHLHRAITAIQSVGKKAGVSINPATPVSTLTDILPIVDLVLVMSVNPGFGGQSFIKETVSKVKTLDELRRKNNYKFLIEIDGGISEKTAGEVSESGCDVFVAGSAIFGNQNYAEAIKKIKEVL